MPRSVSYLNCHPKNKFSSDEDNKLRSLVNQYGESNWLMISKYIPGRNARQCKDRWEKFLSPYVNTKPFSIDEDIEILTLYQKIGSKWTAISKQLKGRSDTSVKSRCQLLIRHKETVESLTKNKITQEQMADVNHSVPQSKDNLNFIINALNCDGLIDIFDPNNSVDYFK